MYMIYIYMYNYDVTNHGVYIMYMIYIYMYNYDITNHGDSYLHVFNATSWFHSGFFVWEGKESIMRSTLLYNI